jgi:serine/threonine protein kinase
MAAAYALREGLEVRPGLTLRRLLGKGSSGQVWDATQGQGLPPLALKFISTESGLATPREIKAIQNVRSLPHPNVTRVSQVWTMPGYLVVAMELAEATLADLLAVSISADGTSVPANLVCKYLSQIADALDFLNARQHRIDGQLVGIQHCGVKGSNILLFGETVKLSDFELSSTTSVPVNFQRQTTTLNYAAPEIFEGYLSPQSDQHSLAVTYCELRSGTLPFPKIELFRQSWPMRRPSPQLSALSAGEQPIIARALSVVPQSRWPSCREMMAAMVKAI